MSLTLSAWWLLLAAVPVLLLGEFIQRKCRVLERYNIPVPVIGGLTICLVILVADLSGLLSLTLQSKVNTPWWTWWVSTTHEWQSRPEKAVNQLFLVGFFTCIGLNASWDLLKKGSWQVPLFLALATALAILQNIVGISIAKLLGENPILGIICGSLSQTGGHGTALGFADTLVQAGYPAAATTGAAAATFGLVAGSLIGGPIAAHLIRRHQLRPSGNQASDPNEEKLIDEATHEPGTLTTMRQLATGGAAPFLHWLLLLALIKAGASVSAWMQSVGLVFPTYMGAMLAGVLLRNFLLLLRGDWIQSAIVEKLGSFTLAIFLATAMMSLNLKDLAGAAGPMLLILAGQIVLSYLFIRWITFRVMGADYDAAVIAAGHCGFGHGATPNAVANMDSLRRKYGPAHRAFLIVPIVGALLIDLVNSLNITWFLNIVR
jgi:glutamate:Na+ symporter, ESS family